MWNQKKYVNDNEMLYNYQGWSMISQICYMKYNRATTNSKTLLENDSYCSENTRANIAKNLFSDKKEQPYFLLFTNLWVFKGGPGANASDAFLFNTALLGFSGYFSKYFLVAKTYALIYRLALDARL